MEKHEQVRLFKERAEAVQTSVTDITGLQQAFLYAIEVTKNQEGSTIAAPALELKERSQLAELCQQAGLRVLAPLDLGRKPVRVRTENGPYVDLDISIVRLDRSLDLEWFATKMPSSGGIKCAIGVAFSTDHFHGKSSSQFQNAVEILKRSSGLTAISTLLDGRPRP